MKSRLPPVNEKLITENSIPNAAPMKIAAIRVRFDPPEDDENHSRIRPTNVPNHAPEAAPASATRG